jgi:hypothetical protein
MLPDGRFPIVAYGGPPPLQTTDYHYAELAHAGFTVNLKLTYDPGIPTSNIDRLRVGTRHNLWTVVHDNRIIIPGRAYATGWRADMDSIVALYANEPGMLGYFISDEPDPKDFRSFAALSRYLARRDPNHPGFVDFMGFPGPRIYYYPGTCYTAYLRRYLNLARPAFFAVDSYPLHEKSDSPYYVTGWDSVAYVARQMGIPFWAILLSTPYKDVSDELRVANAAEMAWQANIPMAYGARGIVWFQYWNPRPTDPMHFHDGPITYDGRHTATYGKVSEMNGRLQLLGQEIGHMDWLGVRHVGALPYACRALRPGHELRVECKTPLTIGFFRQMSGTTYALVVNRDYRKVATAELFAPDTLLRWTRAPGLYRALDASPQADGSIQNELIVGPGDAELVRLSRDFDFSTTQ